MVFFTCNACGESLKKAQVDKHGTLCRVAQGLSCIDCGQDFWGDAYKAHTKCISEDQKYGGKEFEPKSNKGDVKQQQWIQRIHEAMNKPGIGAKLKDVLKQVSTYDNVPRKKAKFQNWMKNSLKIHNPTLHDQVWEIFSAATDNTPSAQQETNVSPTAENGGKNLQQNGGKGAVPEEKSKRERKEERRKKKQLKEMEAGEVEEQDDPAEKKRKKKRKRGVEESKEEGAENKHKNNVEEEPDTRKQKKRKQDTEDDCLPVPVSEENAENDEDDKSTKGKFNWKGTIKAILRQSPEEGIQMKKLRKKVLAAYYAFSGEGNFRSEEELLSLFNKKVNSNPKFRVLKERVRLVK